MSMIKHAISYGIHWFRPAVVLPPLPGEEGEIYDDVVDPNLEVRWDFILFKTLTRLTLH